MRFIPALFALPFLVVAAGCESKQEALPPPAGMAGGPMGTAPQGTLATPMMPASRPAMASGAMGAGAGAGMGSPGAAPANPHGAGFGAPGTAAPSSQPSMVPGGPPGGQIIKGGGQDAVAAAEAAKASFQGSVTETMNAAGYTYARVKTADGNEVWVAVNETQLAVGQNVTIHESITMTDFHSKTLDKTFPSIVFGVLGQ